MSTSTRPKRHPDSSFRTIADEGGLVVLPGRAEVKVLNPVAISIFAMLDGQHTVDQIAAAVVAEYEVDEQQALADVRQFVDELARHGMLAGAADEGS